MFGEAGVETGGPIHIEIGRTGLKGWDKALAGMCKGDKKRAFLPPDLAYGSEGLKECGKDEEVCSHHDRTQGMGVINWPYRQIIDFFTYPNIGGIVSIPV